MRNDQRLPGQRAVIAAVNEVARSYGWSGDARHRLTSRDWGYLRVRQMQAEGEHTVSAVLFSMLATWYGVFFAVLAGTLTASMGLVASGMAYDLAESWTSQTMAVVFAIFLGGVPLTVLFAYLSVRGPRRAALLVAVHEVLIQRAEEEPPQAPAIQGNQACTARQREPDSLS